MFISHVKSKKAVQSSVYLWPSDGDLLLITEPCFAERYALQLQLLSNRRFDSILVYRAALLVRLNDQQISNVVHCMYLIFYIRSYTMLLNILWGRNSDYVRVYLFILIIIIQ